MRRKYHHDFPLRHIRTSRITHEDFSQVLGRLARLATNPLCPVARRNSLCPEAYRIAIRPRRSLMDFLDILPGYIGKVDSDSIPHNYRKIENACSPFRLHEYKSLGPQRETGVRSQHTEVALLSSLLHSCAHAEEDASHRYARLFSSFQPPTSLPDATEMYRDGGGVCLA